MTAKFSSVLTVSHGDSRKLGPICCRGEWIGLSKPIPLPFLEKQKRNERDIYNLCTCSEYYGRHLGEHCEQVQYIVFHCNFIATTPGQNC